MALLVTRSLLISIGYEPCFAGNRKTIFLSRFDPRSPNILLIQLVGYGNSCKNLPGEGPLLHLGRHTRGHDLVFSIQCGLARIPRLHTAFSCNALVVSYLNTSTAPHTSGTARDYTLSTGTIITRLPYRNVCT